MRARVCTACPLLKPTSSTQPDHHYIGQDTNHESKLKFHPPLHRFDRFAMDHLTARKILQGQHHHHRGTRPGSPRLGHRSPSGAHLTATVTAHGPTPPGATSSEKLLGGSESGSPKSLRSVSPRDSTAAAAKQRLRHRSLSGGEDEKIALLSCTSDNGGGGGGGGAAAEDDDFAADEDRGGNANSTSIV